MSKERFDFWYAVNNTEVLKIPTGKLETFGNTIVYYHLLTEVMDAVNKVRVREGKVQAFRPEILTPGDMGGQMLEGFGEQEAERYLDWLKTHEKDLYILKYGFVIKKEVTNEQVISESLEIVKDRVKTELDQKDDPMTAMVVGVEDPWEVCLLNLMVEMIKQSAQKNITQLRADPQGVRHEINRAFREAARDRSRVSALASLLEKHDAFSEYEDRFFALVQRKS